MPQTILPQSCQQWWKNAKGGISSILKSEDNSFLSHFVMHCCAFQIFVALKRQVCGESIREVAAIQLGWVGRGTWVGGRGDLGGPVGKQRSRHREPEMEMKHIVKETAYLWTSEYYLVNPEKLKKAHPTDSFPIIAIQDFEQLIPSQCSMIPDIQP